MRFFILAITTYNRKQYLEKMLRSFLHTQSADRWEIIIADDGSNDGTVEYVKQLAIPDTDITLIENNRTGTHHQTNTIIRELEHRKFDLCFKCDDDILFLKPGWAALYYDAVMDSGYHHLCYFNTQWSPQKRMAPAIAQGLLEARCRAKDIQGAFFTLTPELIQQVGFFDTKNFGFRGVGHIDYMFRACRAGFNDINHPFDAAGSEAWITYQLEDYKPAIDKSLVYALDNEEDVKRKFGILEQERIFIPYHEPLFRLNPEAERDLLAQRIRVLEKEKTWYENELSVNRQWFENQIKLKETMLAELRDTVEDQKRERILYEENVRQTYGHLPGWLLRFGKLFKK